MVVVISSVASPLFYLNSQYRQKRGLVQLPPIPASLHAWLSKRVAWCDSAAAKCGWVGFRKEQDLETETFWQVGLNRGILLKQILPPCQFSRWQLHSQLGDKALAWHEDDPRFNLQVEDDAKDWEEQEELLLVWVNTIDLAAPIIRSSRREHLSSSVEICHMRGSKI